MDTVGTTVKSVVKPIINVNTREQDHVKNESLLNVKLSENPSIKVDAKIVDVEVSKSISVKTPVANAEIGKSIKLGTPIADVNVSDSISIKTSIAKGVADGSIKVDKPEVNKDDSQPSEPVPVTASPAGNNESGDDSDSASYTNPQCDAEVPEEQANEKPVKVRELPAEEITPLLEEAEDNLELIKIETDHSVHEDIKYSLDTDSSKTATYYQVPKEQNSSENENSIEEAFNKESTDEQAVQKAAEKPFRQAAITVPANHGSSSSITIVASGGQSLSGGASFPSLNFNDPALIGELSGKLSYHGNVASFYDQWLNAPPSQPPQPSFFSYVFI